MTLGNSLVALSASTFMVAILYSQAHISGKFLTAAPSGVLSKIYANSMLAVLNARKPIRDRERAGPSVVELPTLVTIR
ncbi:hypothetical protein V8B97DRAFT_425723 [Scleroderma yunnanense]